jgi:hypothetical protein
MFTAFILVSSAQNSSTKTSEIGLNLHGPYSFGIMYKTGSENSKIRITLLSLNGANSTSKYDTYPASSNSGGGIAFNFGFEKRKSITNNLSFYSGPETLLSFRKSGYKDRQTSYSDKDLTISPGLGLTLGFIYRINDDINISAEVIPSILYSYSKSVNRNGGKETTDIRKAFEYGLSNFSLTLSFRLGKKN